MSRRPAKTTARSGYRASTRATSTPTAARTRIARLLQPARLRAAPHRRPHFHGRPGALPPRPAQRRWSRPSGGRGPSFSAEFILGALSLGNRHAALGLLGSCRRCCRRRRPRSARRLLRRSGPGWPSGGANSRSTSGQTWFSIRSAAASGAASSCGGLDRGGEGDLDLDRCGGTSRAKRWSVPVIAHGTIGAWASSRCPLKPCAARAAARDRDDACPRGRARARGPRPSGCERAPSAIRVRGAAADREGAEPGEHPRRLALEELRSGHEVQVALGGEPDEERVEETLVVGRDDRGPLGGHILGAGHLEPVPDGGDRGEHDPCEPRRSGATSALA